MTCPANETRGKEQVELLPAAANPQAPNFHFTLVSI